MRKLVERIFTVAMLFYTTAALSPLITGGDDPFARPEGGLVFIGIQIVLYSVALYLIATRWQPFLHGALKIKWIAVLLAVAVASSAWSQDPALTLRRSLLLIATTAFAIYFATRFEVAEQLRLLAWALGITVCLSFLFGILLPQYGIDNTVHAGDWQGIFSQKNGLARAMVLSALVFLFLRPGFNRALRWIGFTGALGLLVLSRSLSGMIIFVAILGAIPLFKLLRTRFTFAVPVGIALCLLLAASVHMLTLYLPDFFAITGRDSTLTGRTDIWNAVLIAISKHPLAGYGFDSFWLGMKGESANVLYSVRWAALHAHNGFLDLWLDLGAVGVAAFVGGYLLLWRRALQVLKSGADSTAVWLCLYLVFTVLYNLTESALVRENTIFWVLYIATAVNIYLFELPLASASEVSSDYGLKPNLNYLS